MRAPAHQRGHGRIEALVHQEGIGNDRDRPDQQGNDDHGDQLGPVGGPQLIRRHRRQHVHQIGTIADQHDLDDRNDKPQRHRRQDHLAGRPQQIQIERHQPVREPCAFIIGLIGIDKVFEKAEHWSIQRRK